MFITKQKKRRARKEIAVNDRQAHEVSDRKANKANARQVKRPSSERSEHHSPLDAKIKS